MDGEADRLLEDAVLIENVYEAQGRRHAQSRTRARLQTPAEVALRLLILKHVPARTHKPRTRRSRVKNRQFCDGK